MSFQKTFIARVNVVAVLAMEDAGRAAGTVLAGKGEFRDTPTCHLQRSYISKLRRLNFAAVVTAKRSTDTTRSPIVASARTKLRESLRTSRAKQLAQSRSATG